MFARKFRPALECLEGRDCPAPLTSVIDFLGNLRIMGDVDNANGGLQIIATGANTLDVIDGITPFLTGVSFSGNLILQTGAADDIVLVDLSGGSLTGNFQVEGGKGSDLVDIFGGSIGGSVFASGVNTLFLTMTAVGGSVNMNASMETLSLALFLFDAPVTGGVSAYGGPAPDVVGLSAGSVGGNVYLNLFGGSNSFDLSGSAVSGNLTVVGGAGNDGVVIDAIVNGQAYISLGAGVNSLQLSGSLLGSLTMTTGVDNDTVTLDGFIGGNVSLNLGDGNNTVDFNGTMTGQTFAYKGGSGVDMITLNAGSTASLTHFDLRLGAGADVVDLNFVSIKSLYADFGDGVDTLFDLPLIPNTLKNLENLL